MALLGRDARALAVGDAFVGGESRRLAGKRDPRGLFAVDVPGMEQVQVGLLVGLGDVLCLRQAGHRVLGGETRDVVGGLHRLLERCAREVGGAGVAPLAADVDRDAEGLVPVALDVLPREKGDRFRNFASVDFIGVEDNYFLAALKP